MSDALDQLREAEVLTALDVQTARALGRLAGEQDEAVLLALAMVSHQALRGHVCLELDRLEEQGVLAPVRAALGREPWPSPSALKGALRDSALVGVAPAEHQDRPLWLDRGDRLYLRRLYDQERSVARAIRALAEAPACRVDEAVLQDGLSRLFPTGDKPSVARPSRRADKRAASDQLDLFGAAPEPHAKAAGASHADDAQRSAAEGAVRRRLCVVSGGPGTGKTSTVVKILALLVEQARALGQAPPTILLLAPTGKAAARLSESVQSAKARLECSPEVRAAIVDRASTLHRALGVRRQPHDARGREPLAASVVVVDEASMVDLAMMDKLLAAVPEHARLILLGDKDQLASVEAGAVLGDICGEGARASGPSPLARSITTLTRSHRFADDSAIKQLAEAVREGRAARALELLRAGGTEIELREPERQDADPALIKAAVERFAALFEGEPTERLAALERFRVLCAHRKGPLGVVDLNARIEHALRRAGLIHPGVGPGYLGRPILITENSYEAKLWNGDVGVLAAGRQVGLRACFAAADAPDGVRRLPLARLPAHESVYAMSVHKSQGSEVDEVAVVLPAEDSPLLSRELLYTAVTRARARVVIYARASVLELCIERRVARASGLREALWG